MEEYDVIVVGSGPMGIFTCYELSLRDPKLKILLVDKGHDIYHRRCAILEKKIAVCPSHPNGEFGCFPACSITCGFGGAGAYSDGKFNITDEFGGWLNDFLPNSQVINLIKYVDQINIKHGATLEITNPYTDKVKEIERRGYAVGLKLLRANVRHLGTEENLKIMKNIYEYLKDKVQYRFLTTIEDIIVENGQVKGVVTNKKEEIRSKYVVIGPGRDGSKWLEALLRKNKVNLINNQVDIGVRVETNNVVMEEINESLYEGKFIYNTSVGTKVRTFCSNPSGHVVIENQAGIMMANGHAYRDLKYGSNNTNFAVLVSHVFSEPFDEPNQFAQDVAKLANKLTHGSIIVQKFGDIIRGRRTTEKRLSEGFVSPTLKEAIPGDLGLVLPYNTMKSIIEMIQALDHVTPGIASEHTLLYGVEAKFYSARPETDSNFETKIKNLFVGGDGAGVTRGLAQAGANGVAVARRILEKEGKIV